MAHIVLGTDTFCDAVVEWQVTSKANPHLMVVGLPSMVKTEALLNICEQLGFNPMHVEQQLPHAHIDNAKMLRDIFAAMFPDLGDEQLEKIRSAIR